MMTIAEARSLGGALARFGGVSFCMLQLIDAIMCVGPSMLPTLNRDGDIILLDKITPRFRKLHKGEVVIAKSATNPKHTVCKRIIAEVMIGVCCRALFKCFSLKLTFVAGSLPPSGR